MYHMVTQPKTAQRSFRLSTRTLELLDAQAAAGGESRNALADRLLGSAGIDSMVIVPRAAPHLLATSLTYLAPTPQAAWKPVTLGRDSHLSLYFCSGYVFDVRNGDHASAVVDRDIIGYGC